MKQLTTIITAVLLSAVVLTPAYASDSIRTHNGEQLNRLQHQYQRCYIPERDVYFNGPVVRGGYYDGAGLFYGSPPVVYVPQLREHEFLDDEQYIGRRYRDHSDNRFSRKHHSRHRNNYYGYGDYR